MNVVRWTGLALLLAACGGTPQRTPPQSASQDQAPAFEPPVVTNPESPVSYPPDLYDQRVEGTVVLRLYVDERGQVVPDSTRIAESSGYPALDSAALRGVPDTEVYPLLFGMSLLENLFPPFPGDAVTVFGGFLAGIGRLSLPLVFLMVTAGGWLGFMVYYALGCWLGRGRAHALLARWVSPLRLGRAEAWFLRYGRWVVLANRFLAGTRAVISLVAGFSRLPPLSVSAFALLSCLVWNSLLLGAGYLIGDQWERVADFLSTYNTAVLGLLALLTAWWLVRRWRAGTR